MHFAVFAENDESRWRDDTGVLYHFPRRYASIVVAGTFIVYYKGKMRSQRFASERLSIEPHYFGRATVGTVYPDAESRKGDLFATIENFARFRNPVPIRRADGRYYETIPPNRMTNHWRDGVRSLSANDYAAIVGDAGPMMLSMPVSEVNEMVENEFESAEEGRPHLRYVTTYERDPKYRRQAIAIHGTRCVACEIDMGERYGVYAQGLIHVHHVQPVSTYEEPKRIDPANDLVPVCPSCHAVIHRKKAATLSIAELRTMLGAPN
ncbi:MAG: HNH endonuclease [Burkholderiales bacterium]|nr:HNH endonuclease [Burkholderiales bacterium]